MRNNRFKEPKIKQYFINSSTLYKKIAVNTISQIFSKIATALISIVLIGILTKTLPQELYGSYNKVFSYLGIFAFLADLGLYTWSIREISKFPEQKERIVGNVLSLRLVLGIMSFIIAIFLAFFLPGYDDMYTLSAIFVCGIFTILSLLNSAILALMQSQLKMEFSLFSVVSGKIINLALVSFFLLYFFKDMTSSYFSFLSVFISATIGIALNTGMNFLYARKICSLRFRFEADFMKKMFLDSLPYGVALFLSVVYFKVDTILISVLEAPEKADISIALYSLPMKIIEVLMVLGGFYLNSLLPKLTQLFKEKQYESIVRLFEISLKILGSFGIFIVLLGYIFRYEIIRIIASQDYITPAGHSANSIDVLGIVFFVLLFYFLAMCSSYILIAAEKQKTLLYINIFLTLFNIFGNILLIQKFSFMGSAYVTLLSQILLFGLTLFFARKSLKFGYSVFFQIFKSAFLSLSILVLYNFFGCSQMFSDFLRILVFGGMITIFYIAAEYGISKKYIQARI